MVNTRSGSTRSRSRDRAPEGDAQGQPARAQPEAPGAAGDDPGLEVLRLRSQLAQKEAEVSTLRLELAQAKRGGGGEGARAPFAYKEIANLLVELFGIVEGPSGHGRFAAFVEGGLLFPEGECGPLVCRRQAILARPDFVLLKEFLAAKRPGEVDAVLRTVLNECLALFFVTRNPLCPVSLGEVLALAKAERLSEARAVTREKLANIPLVSEVSSVLLAQYHRGGFVEKPWKVMEMGWVTGEKISSVGIFHQELTLVLSNDTCAPSQLSSLGTTIRPESSVSAALPPGGYVTQPVLRGGGSLLGTKSQAPSVLDVKDRCMRCGKRGHNKAKCHSQPHPEFDPANPYRLLNLIAHGQITPP